MSAQVQSIAEWMATVIKLTAPAIRPDVAYVQASGMSPIQELEPDGLLSMREFQVQSGPIVEMGEFIGPCYELWREMDVVMRYMRDERQGDEWREVDRMAASDFDRVLLALTRPPLQSPWSSAGVWNIQFSAHDKLAKSERFKGVWEQRIVFRVLYSVTDLVQDWTYSVEYNTLTALKAALNGRPVGTTARLVNARTSELIGVWKVGSTKACPSVDFTKADGPEFADGVDIISQGAGSWSITYGTGIVVVDDAAEFYGYAETDNSDVLVVGTHATYERGEVQSYTSLGDLQAEDGADGQQKRLFKTDAVGTWSEYYRWRTADEAWVLQPRTFADVMKFVAGADLEAAWEFEELTGTVAANTGNPAGSSPGTYLGGFTLGTASQVAGDKRGVTLDGVTGQVDMGDVLDVGLGSFSLVVWLRITDVSSINQIVGKVLATPYFFIRSDASLGATAPVTSIINDGTNFALANAVITKNALTMVALVVDRGSDLLTIYINATPSTPVSIAAVGDLDNTNNFRVGNGFGGGQFAAAEFFEVAKASAALTADEITHIYNAGVPQ